MQLRISSISTILMPITAATAKNYELVMPERIVPVSRSVRMVPSITKNMFMLPTCSTNL
jgi:hypothetical protein